MAAPTFSIADAVGHEDGLASAQTERTCKSCSAWRPSKAEMDPWLGGCALSGKVTLHYGDTAYKLYTTDLTTCSRYAAKR